MKLFPISNFKNERSVNIYIGKKYGVVNFLLKNNIEVEKCAFCDNYAKVKIHWKIKNGFYIIDYIEYPLGKYCKSDNCPGKKLNPVSKEFLKKAKGLTDEEIQKKLSDKANKGSKTLHENGWYEDKSNNPFSKQYWIKKGFTEEESQEIIYKRTDKTHKTLHENGWYEDKSNNPFSKQYWIKKGFTEEESQEKVNSRNRFTKNYWIKKGYSEKDAEKIARKTANTISQESFVERYGIIDGNIKYNEAVNKISKANKGIKKEKYCYTYGGKSKEASILFEKLYFFVIKHGIDDNEIFYNNIEKTKKEFWLKYKTDKTHTFLFDFAIKNKKILIEYNGSRWHPDHRKNERLTKWRDVHTKESYYRKLKHDLMKVKVAKKNGYKILILWSNDSFDENINKCKNFIIENI